MTAGPTADAMEEKTARLVVEESESEEEDDAPLLPTDHTRGENRAASRMALAVVVSALLAYAVAFTVSRMDGGGFELMGKPLEWHTFATKTVYWDQRDDMKETAVHAQTPQAASVECADMELTEEVGLESLRLVQTQLVARHGIRYPTLDNTLEIQSLVSKLAPFADKLPVWLRNYTLPYNESVEGELADAGYAEVQQLAHRMLKLHGHHPHLYSPDTFRLAHTHVRRTKDSAHAFASSFFQNPLDVNYIEYPKEHDPVLRFFDACPRYQQQVKHNKTAFHEVTAFASSSLMTESLAHLTRALGLESEAAGLELTIKDLSSAFSACAFDIAIYQIDEQWCSLMRPDIIHAMDYYDDLKEFYQLGGGYPINYEMAAVLLQDIFKSIEQRIAGSSRLQGDLRFAHAETTLPLMTLLGFGDRTPLTAEFSQHEIKTRGFRTSVLAPFAANVEFRLFSKEKNGSSKENDYFVQVLVNERSDVAVPGCHGHVFCPFLMRNNSPSSTEYYVSLQCGKGQAPQTRTVKVTGEGELVWKDPLVGLISKLPAPLVVLSLYQRSQDQKNDPDVIVGVVALPVFPTILSDNHLVGFALPLVASEKGNGGGARKRQGVLSFEMQFVASTASAASVSSSTGTRLVLHQLIGWREGGLIPPLIRHIRLQVLLVGATVSETLWTHESEVLGVQTQSPTLSLDLVVTLDEAIRKTRVNLSKRLDLVVRVCDVDRNRLGQTIIPVRGSWEKLMEREQEALHKIYRSSTSGDPEAVAQIQLTIEKVSSTSTSDVIKDVRDPADGWLYVEILEAFNASVTSQKEEAAVQIALQWEVDVEKALRPKPWKSRKQWSTRSGEWRWVDEFAPFPYHCEKPCTLELSILLSTNGDQASTSALDIEAIVHGASESPHEEWIAIDTSQLHVRFVYLPATAGYLSVKINSVTALRTSKLPYPIDRVALKCSDGSNSTSSKPQDIALADATEMSVLQTLVNVTARLSLDFARSRPRSPYLTIEAVGMSSTLGETRIGRACVPLVPLLSTQTDQWLVLLAPDDLTIQFSAMHCSFQFRQATAPSTSGSLAAIPPEIASHDEWHRISAAVMAIWKKLFYYLDADRNGKVDLDEFKSLFRDHFKLFSSTSDGQTLLRLLTTQPKSDISESTVEHLFHEMDINDNEEIDWNEYIMFLQAKLHAIEPVEASVTPPIEPLTEDSTQNSSKQTELRRKRREDPLSPCTANGSQRKTESVRAPTLARPDRLLGKRSSSRVNGSASRVASNERCLSRFEVSETPELELLREENAQVRAQLRAVEAQLALEQQRSRRQNEAMQALQRQLTQFQLQQHKARVEEQTKAQRIQETIQRHEQELLVREATRKKHQAASIVLQSRVRTRLETKRYQALRMTRWNASVRIQCWFRMIQAQKWLKVHRELARIKRLRHTSATRLQWFARYHLCRKERQLLIGARNLAATIIQKYTRRLQALRERHSRMRATLSVQSRVKLWLAQREADRLRRARDVLRHRLRGWALRHRWNHVQCSIRKMQRWWRVACDQRWEYFARLEAAVCIQATWRGILHRRRWARGNYEAQATLTENQTNEDADAIPLADLVESNSFALESARENLEMASNGGEIESFLVLADENCPLDEDLQGDFTEFAMEGGDHGEASSPDLPLENTEPFLVTVEGVGLEESVRRMLADNGDQDHMSSAEVELTDEHVFACLYELIDAIDQVASLAACLPVNDTRSDGTDAPRSFHAEERTTSDPDEPPDSPTSTPESDFIGGEMSNSTKIQDTPECEVIATTDDAKGTVDVPPSRREEEAILTYALASVIDTVVAMHEQNRSDSDMVSQREAMVDARPDTEAPGTFGGLSENEEASARQQDATESLCAAVVEKQPDGESVGALTEHQMVDDEDTPGPFDEEFAGDTCVPPVDDVIVGDEDERECEVKEIAQDALAKATDDDELPHDQVHGTHSDAGNPDGTMDEGLSELDNVQHQLKENDLGGTPAAELQDSKTDGAPDSSFADSAYESSESVSPVLYEPDVSTPLLEEDPNDGGEEAEYQTNADVTPITHPDPIEIESEPNLDHAETTNEGGTFVDELMTNEVHDGASNDLTGEHESGTVQATGGEPAKVDCEEQDAPSSEDGGADRGVTAEDKHLHEAPTSLLEDQFEDESNPKGMTVPNVSSLSDSPADTTKHSEVQDENIAVAITDEESSKNELDTNFTVDIAHSDDLTQTALSELGPSVIQEPGGEVLEEAMQSEDSKDMTDIVELSTAIESIESPRGGDSESEADRNADSVDSDALMHEAGEVAVFDPREVVSNGPPQAGEAEVQVPIPQEPDNKVELTRQDSEAFLADFAAFGPTSTEAMGSGSETPVLMMAALD
ncbi:hypothetical protein Poli38472_009052 [Pythium oligandrum]|uniref:Multiple inositol polyphosphate phosphatase 1 n=1 Tax=Pythium oligandrum TaxID=41045 RepID=A0A8K1CKE8_PYTOL|nr:hypothetical protein Poli38472_009052 [Pythium oligandrum]|eukprot:TMW64885.1 hypothetical protein Poli38472_009052 [Pythium oligandrum]